MAREFTVVMDDVGDVVILEKNGKEVPQEVGRKLALRLGEKYERKTYSLYLAESKADPTLLKVGISNDVYRRMNELDAKLIAHTACNYRRVRTIEAVIHDVFSYYCHHGEWYEFGDFGIKFIEWFKQHNTQKSWITWLYKIPSNIPRTKHAPLEWHNITENPFNLYW